MLTFDEKTHTYFWKERPRVSSTQALNRVAVKKKDNDPFVSFGQGEFFKANGRSSNFGTQVHTVAKYRLNNHPCTYDEKLQPWVDGLEKFLKDHEFLLFESKRLYVIDWKTSTANQHHWPLQTASYDELVKVNYGSSKDPVFLVEEMMYHQILEYAGTPDWVVGNPSAPITQRHRWTVRLTEGGYDLQKRCNEVSDLIKFKSILNTYHAA